jgi:hypothetical protein
MTDHTLVHEVNGLILSVPKEHGVTITVTVVKLGLYWEDPSRRGPLVKGQSYEMKVNANGQYIFVDKDIPWFIYDPVQKTLEHYR